MRLEPTMWDALEEIGEREGQSVHSLATQIDRRRRRNSLTSATRVYILTYFKALAEDLEGRLDGPVQRPPAVEALLPPQLSDSVLERLFDGSS